MQGLLLLLLQLHMGVSAAAAADILWGGLQC
jgi:hypothetical protein